MSTMKPNHGGKLGKKDQQMSNNIQSKRLFSGSFKPHISEALHSAPNSMNPDPLTHKKTRDLPNLTECHACGFRVDVSNGKNRLHILYSEWRIVLLCKKCFCSVESSQICSYCFLESSGECFRCGNCNHCVHKKCILNYKDDAPWLYSGLGSEFSICVDCWVPKSVEISRRLMRSKKIRKKSKASLETENSKVSNGGNSLNSLEAVVKDANCQANRKIEAASRAREEATTKAAVARRAVELANNALNLVPKRDEDSVKKYNEMDACKFIDDAELAFQLHRAINSSPRISKTRRLLNTSHIDIPKILGSNTESLVKAPGSSDSKVLTELKICSDIKLYENPDNCVSEPSVSVSGLDRDSSTDMSSLNSDKRIDRESGPKDGECLAEGDTVEGEGSCSNKVIKWCDEHNSMDFDRKPDESTLLGKERYKERPDRYFLKYRRRGCRAVQAPDSKPKILYDGILLESQASAAGVPPQNCSEESRTLSNSSYQSFDAPL
ncbi:NADPH-dependent 7-cyano-7-deazaguanine reductase [Quillaja saponaria]|uniref:NADPH-dependent 7-cyano-7-deazaguanine reductase n=1 Tax=Quillaja saponaria TaxID=32244 RepID=A0AAD7M1T5_QUISA|nr:NADPH-dependent 7-cyano-7-deazaguanine reductase [Quillaja saponaria]